MSAYLKFKGAVFACLILLAFGCGKSPEQHGAEFIQAGMFEQAKVYLTDEILKNPKNPELHFLLGKALLALGEVQNAQVSFDRATRLDPSKGKLIGWAYLEVAQNDLKRKNPQKAWQLFGLASKYDPSLRNKIGELFFSRGKESLSNGKIDRATAFFSASCFYNPSLKKMIGREYLEAGKRAFNENNLDKSRRLFALASKENSPLNSEIATILTKGAIAYLEKDKFKEAENLSQEASNYDLNTAKKIAIKALEKGKVLADSDKTDFLLALGQIGVSLNKDDAKEWGELIYQNLKKNQNSLMVSDLIQIGNNILAWAPSLKSKIAEIYLDRARKELAGREVPAHQVCDLLKNTESADSQYKDKAAMLIWEWLSKNLRNLKEMGVYRFTSLFGLFEELRVPSNIQKTPAYLLASGLNLYEKNSKEAAYDVFRNLAQKFPDSEPGKKAKEILAPPAPGRRTFSGPPLKFATWWSGQARVSIRLLYVDVFKDGIKLTFSVTADDRKHIFWNVTGIYKNFKWIEDSRMYIVDDNGKKYPSNTGFVGGIQKVITQNYANQIIIQPHEKVVLSIDFPMISPGATSITFVSPQKRGHQNKWCWNDIKLKNGPFDSTEARVDQGTPQSSPLFSSPQEKSISPPASPQRQISHLNNDNRWPWTSQRLVTKEDIRNLSSQDLVLMRNEIYARHGWVFNRKDLREYFNKQAWYHPKGLLSNRADANRLAAAEMSPLERQNVQIILRYEKSHHTNH
jgi:tetratricopeptide (TPR) repeat protein